jgi:hypothetical protein
MTLRKREVLEIERGSTRSHPVEKWFWMGILTCRETEYGMNEEVTL